MQRSFFFPCSVYLALLVPCSFGQDATSPAATPPQNESTTDATTATDPDVAEEPKLSPQEFVQKLIASDPNDQFQMLPRVSPRGVDSKTRAEIVQLLLPLLASEYPDIRARTASAIGLFGEESHVAIPALLNLIGDAEQTAELTAVWTVVSQSLAGIGVASIEPAMERMKTAEGWEFHGLTSIISDLGEEEAARATAPYFLDQLKNGPEERKWACMYCLARLGDVAKPAIPEYIKYLDHSEFNMQVIACRALAALGRASKAAAPKLVQLMDKKGNMLSTRTHAAMCLGAIGPIQDSNVDLVELFKSMISEPNAFCQERGLIALGRLGPFAKDAAPFVANLLEDTEFSQRPEAALTLWQISGDAERSIAILKPMMEDPTFEFRTLEAIKAIGPAAVPLAELLVERLNTDDASLQLEIAQVLEAMGPAAAKYVEKLRPLADTAPPDIAIELDEIVARLHKTTSL